MKEIYILVRKFPEYPEDGNEVMTWLGFFTDRAEAEAICRAEMAKIEKEDSTPEIWFVRQVSEIK